ncbi:MAG: hypothetical protein HC807_08620 [Gammaproteobacteria bacterium]|nr:hypothetical protein [Gammaproteobacteria bacterium]
MGIRLTSALICSIAWLMFAVPANAMLLSVTGPNSNLGAAPAIIAAPPDVNDDAAYNTGMQGFDERQNVLLGAAILIDGGGSIAAGTRVNSHMIFLNTGPGNNTTANGHYNVVWTFDGIILGIMSNQNGSLEVSSSGVLGAIGTAYPNAPFAARGIENNNGGVGPFSADGYTILTANTLRVGMSVTEPGDWIRVVTSVPEPGTDRPYLASLWQVSAWLAAAICTER